MKNYLLLILLYIVGISCYSQEVTIKKRTNSYSSLIEASKNSELTTKYVVIKGVKYFLYTTNRGSYFIILNKENSFFRRYVKINS
jgi:hypothetical protein